MIILDSCVWIALLREADSQHQKALKLFPTLNVGDIRMFDCIFSEVLSVLRLRSSDQDCEAFLNLLNYLNIDLEFISEENFINSVPKFFEHQKASFVDSILLQLKAEGYEIITFDKNFFVLLFKFSN